MAIRASAATAQPASAPLWRLQGQIIWANTPDGRIKARAYSSAHLSRDPVLVLWLHGDLGPGSELYEVLWLLVAVAVGLLTIFTLNLIIEKCVSE